jgi:hypothetical protein
MRRLNSREILSDLLGSLCLLLLVAALVLAMPVGTRADDGGDSELAVECTGDDCVCQIDPDTGDVLIGYQCLFCVEGGKCWCTLDINFDPPPEDCVIRRIPM